MGGLSARSRAPVSSRAELVHMLGALSFASNSLGFVAAAQGTPLDCVGMVANGLVFMSSSKNSCKESLNWLSPQGVAQRGSSQKYPSSSTPPKDVYLHTAA